MILAHDCAAVVPCLNEAAAIENLVRSIRRHLMAVMVVDDGSTDATGRLAKKAGAEVLRHSVPQGKAAALLAGWRWAREHGFRRALSLDGDGQHSPDDIPVFLSHARRCGAELVVGNRMDHAESMPPLRRFVNRWMSERISSLAGRSLPDSQCGFRLMDLEAWSRLEIAATHFQIESEILLAFSRAGLGVQFVPIQVLYKDEQSKIRPVQDALRWFRWWLRARCRPQQVAVSPRSHVPGLLASKIVRAPK